MINPAGIPSIPGDMDALAAHARALSSTGGEFSDTGQRVNTTWQGLAAVYRAPEAGQLLAATAPVQAISASVAADLQTAGSALAAYASEVKGIQARLEALRTQAVAFVHSVHGQHDWQSDSHKVDHNNQLINAVNVEVAAFFDAQRRCANAINALYGGQQYHADNGHQGPGDYGYTAGQLEAAAQSGQNLPWGKDEQHDRGLLGDIGAFFGGIWDSGKDSVLSLGGLIGYASGHWSFANAGTAWEGMGTFALAVGVYSQPTGMILDETTGVPGLKRDQLGDTLTTAGKNFSAYHEWSKDPARAAGTVIFNIVTAVVGTKGAGAALHSVGTAAETSNIATVARLGSVATRGGDLLTKIPTVSDVAGNVLKRIPTLHLPDLHAPDLEIPTEHIDTPVTEHIPETHTGTIGDALGHTQRLPETHIPEAHDGLAEHTVETAHPVLHSGQAETDAPYDSVPSGGHDSDTGGLHDEGQPGDVHSHSEPIPQRVPAGVGASKAGSDLHAPPVNHEPPSSEAGTDHGSASHDTPPNNHHEDVPKDANGAPGGEHPSGHDGPGPQHDTVAPPTDAHSVDHSTAPGGPPQAATVKIWHEHRMPKTEFRSKAQALQRLSDEGKLSKAHNPVPRDPKITKQYRQSIIDRIYRQYHQTNPEFANKLIERVTRRMSPDHIHELQLGGPDTPENLKMLDRFTNEHIGLRQIWPQIKQLPDGTPVRIEVIE